MKYFLSITFLFVTLCSCAQSKKVRIAMSNAGTLEYAVFDTKDSAALEKLFAKTLTYEHSSGKVETREQAIQGITHNKSTYVKDIYPYPYNVNEKGDSIIVKKVFKATEKKADGTESLLNLTIETVWIKENGDWKLVRRKAVKNL